MDIRAYNRKAWDQQDERGNPWTVPVSPEKVAAARKGDWSVVLTETKPVPRDWFPELKDLEVLCLASGGGQQGPILAAAGAKVTVLDNSPRQLEKDRFVAGRDSLSLATLEGDMADLSVFPNERFGLVFHPVSNLFVPDVRPVWREAFRVLRHGGLLLAGFMSPAVYIFDLLRMERDGVLEVKYSLPYADITHLPPEQLEQFQAEGNPLEFSHTLEEQIGGQLEAGFHLTGFYEDYHDPQQFPLARYMPTYIATRAVKP